MLDIGCGTGRSTLEAARLASDGSVLGIDLSSQMLACAAERAAAEGVSNVTFVQGDAQVHPFEPGAADVAISHYGAMFFGDPVAAFTNIARGLRPGGRLALLAWRELERNEWLTTVRGALALGRELPHPPAGRPDPLLAGRPGSRAGAPHRRRVRRRSSSNRSTSRWSWGRRRRGVRVLQDGPASSRASSHGVDDAGRAQALDNLHAAFKEAETSEGVLLGTSAWLITATRA